MMPTNILIVDDDEIMLNLLEYFFLGYNCSVTRAVDGEMALQALHAAGFDMVITDLQMGRISGLDVAREAKAINPGITVFILTGCDDGTTAGEAFRLGVAAYLLKPISFRNLVDRMREEAIFLVKKHLAGKTGAVSECFTSCQLA